MIQFIFNLIADLTNFYLIHTYYYNKFCIVFFYLFIVFVISNRERFPNYYHLISDLYLSISFYLFMKHLLES